MKKSLVALSALSAMAAMGEVSIASTRVSCDAEFGNMRRVMLGNLAYQDAADLNTKLGYMHSDGNSMRVTGQVAVASNPAANDIIRFCVIPAGMVVDEVIIANADLDSNGAPTLVHSLGFEPVDSGDGPTADYAYFAAAGQTTLQSASDGKSFNKFAPKKFERAVYLCAKVGTGAATFAAGTVYAKAIGTAELVK
jgi:hypothetical protein